MRTFFYDTWAFLALANRRDPHHRMAADADRALEQAGHVAVTSDYVIDETITGLQVAAGSRVALRFLELLEQRVAGDELLLAEVSSPRRERAIASFRRLSPQIPRISFTDCTSFVLMRELGVRLAFTADRHFHQAGGGVCPLFERHGSVLAMIPLDAD